MARWPLACVLAMAGATAFAADDLRIPIHVDRPSRVAPPHWPVTCGVPFRQGALRDAAALRLVDEGGKPIACQVTRLGDWPDGSVRWALLDFDALPNRKQYLVSAGVPDQAQERPDDVRARQENGATIVVAGGAEYSFRPPGGCFQTLRLDLDKDGRFAPDETLVDGAGEAFYLVDSQGRRSALKAASIRVEIAGPRRAVVRVEGDYLTPEGARNAAAVVYFHFFAGHAACRIQHKLIVTEDTNRLWFRDIGLALPVRSGDKPAATFNVRPDDTTAVFTRALTADGDLVMVQETFPHFGQRESRYGIRLYGRKAASQVGEGPVCGDWADVSSSRWGLAAQVPAFAEQFPKAFRLNPAFLTVKLWAGESGQELDFRTDQVIRDYFGHDWIHPDHPVTKTANVGQGTARTHDIWLYPHAGNVRKETMAGFAATRDEIYACADPSWTTSTGVFGLVHPKDVKRFGQAEQAIEDYFLRTVTASQRVFPATGYMAWGVYPYGCAQGWAQRKANGDRWYPSIHRLSRCLEYNFKRAVWVLYARSGERAYHDCARRYTRHLGDFLFSNCDALCKPKGWLVMGSFDSPAFWGAFGAEAIERCRQGRTPAWSSESSTLAVLSSEDVIQFVYDYFLSGDLHSRDSARGFIEAALREMDADLEKPLLAGGTRPEGFLRMLGSAYDLDHDPRILDLGTRYLRRLALPDGTISDEFPSTRRVKWGDYFSVFYYYYVSTGDPLALEVLLRRAEFEYRYGLESFFGRSSPLLAMFALLHQQRKDPAHAAYLSGAIRDFGRTGRVLERLGVKIEDLNQDSTVNWGQDILTANCPVNIGIPAAMAAVAGLESAPASLPVAEKPYPTARTRLVLRREAQREARIDLYVNNYGDRTVESRLLDLDGKAVPVQTAHREGKRIYEVDWERQDTEWLYRYEDQVFLRLAIPASVPAGVYALDLGAEVTFKVLWSDIPQMVQVAPDGMVILPGNDHFIRLPQQATAVDFFTTRPVNVYDPAGKQVGCEDLKQGHFRFATEGRDGAWRIENGKDKYLHVTSAAAETFLRLDRVATPQGDVSWPVVHSLGDPARFFDFDAARFQSARPQAVPKADEAGPFSEPPVGPAFGKALHLSDGFIEATLPEGMDAARLPHASGTVEFWWRPMWSATDAQMFTTNGSYQNLQVFHVPPVSFSYVVQPDHGGRQGFLVCYLNVQVDGAGWTQTRFFAEAGRWRHVAFAWNVDGKDSFCRIFVDGRRRAHTHYNRGMVPSASPDKLKPFGRTIRFGSGRAQGGLATSEMYDELRVSRVARYREDFEPPSQPFAADADTFLLMHLDGGLDGLLDGKPVKAELKRRGRMW